jgi:hypothetical protein
MNSIKFSKVLTYEPHVIITNNIKESQIEVTDYIEYIDPIIFIFLLDTIIIMIIFNITQKKIFKQNSSFRYISDDIWNLVGLLVHQRKK